MLRLNITDGSDPLVYILNKFGNPTILAARSQFLNVMYHGTGSALSPREREAIRMPIVRNLGCHTCISSRLWRDLPGFSDEIDEAFYENAIALNLDWSGFSDRERFLVNLAEQFESDYAGLNGDDDLWERADTLFAEEELGDAFILLATLSGNGHKVIALGGGNVCDVPDLAGMSQLVSTIGGVRPD